jgi:hypothetical protein
MGPWSSHVNGEARARLYIRQPQCTLREATFVPPPPGEVPNSLGALETFLQAEDELRGVAEVSVEAAETARRILTLRETHRSAITEKLGRAAGNGHRVLERLYEQPIVSVKHVQGLLGTTYAGANQIVERLVGLGVLREITGQSRNRRFRYDAYVRLFEEGAQP